MASTRKHRERKGSGSNKNTNTGTPTAVTSYLSSKLEQMFPDDWRLQRRFQVPNQPTTTGGGLRPAVAG